VVKRANKTFKRFHEIIDEDFSGEDVDAGRGLYGSHRKCFNSTGEYNFLNRYVTVCQERWTKHKISNDYDRI
jgi:hypothetical protein